MHGAALASTQSRGFKVAVLGAAGGIGQVRAVNAWYIYERSDCEVLDSHFPFCSS